MVVMVPASHSRPLESLCMAMICGLAPKRCSVTGRLLYLTFVQCNVSVHQEVMAIRYMYKNACGMKALGGNVQALHVIFSRKRKKLSLAGLGVWSLGGSRLGLS